MSIRFIFTLFIILPVIAGIVFADNSEKAANVEGEWDLTITFILGTGYHSASIKQDGDKLSGTYKGAILEGTLSGTVKGDSIEFTSRMKYEATGIRFHFTGTVEKDTMKGSVDDGANRFRGTLYMDKNLRPTTWTAKRAQKKK